MWPCFGNDYLIYCILDLNLAQNKLVARASFSKVRLYMHFLEQYGFCIYPLSANEEGLHTLNWKTHLDIFEET